MLFIGKKEEAALNEDTARKYLTTFMNKLHEDLKEYIEEVSPLPPELQDLSVLPADQRAVILYADITLGKIRHMLSHKNAIEQMNDTASDIHTNVGVEDDPDAMADALDMFDKLYIATPVRTREADWDHIALMEEYTTNLVKVAPTVDPRFYIQLAYDANPGIKGQDAIKAGEKAEPQCNELIANVLKKTNSRMLRELQLSYTSNNGRPAAILH